MKEAENRHIPLSNLRAWRVSHEDRPDLLLRPIA